MSIANLLVPNDLNLFCNTITPNSSAASSLSYQNIIPGAPSNSFYITDTATILPSTASNTMIGVGVNAVGNNNVLYGDNTGTAMNSSNNNCTLIGYGANVSTTSTFATSIGSGASNGASNSVMLGRENQDDTYIGRSLYQISQLAASANICNGASISGAQVVNVCSGVTPAASQTVNILNSTSSAGAQALNIATSSANTSNIVIGAANGTGTCAINIPTKLARTSISAGVAVNVTDISGLLNYPVLITDNVIFVTASGGGPCSVTLAAATFTKGTVITVKKVDSSVNAVTISATGGSVDGGTISLATQYSSATLVLDTVSSNSWYVIAKV